MFIEVDVRDCVRIPAACIINDVTAPVLMALQHKYGNRVIRDQGLCVCVRHISSIDVPFLYPGDSGAFIRVQFSLVLFRPFLYEVLVGRVRHSDASGILVSFGFTEDVFIPKDNLPDPSVFDEDEQLWYWKYLDNQMYIDIGEEIRLRVVSIQFSDKSAGQAGPNPDPSRSVTLLSDLRPTMVVLGSIAEDGLGMVRWWQQQYDDDNDQDQDQEQDPDMDTAD